MGKMNNHKYRESNRKPIKYELVRKYNLVGIEMNITLGIKQKYKLCELLRKCYSSGNRNEYRDHTCFFMH